jgi:hypothetical protein
MRLLKTTIALLAVPAAITLSACGADIEVGDQVAVADATITADGHTYSVSNLQINGSTATAKTKSGKKLTFEKVDGHWTVAK